MTYHIDNIAFGGEGVARKEGLAVFIPFTLPKETVQAQITQKKSNFARAHLLQVLEKSPDRIEPLCSYFSTCGGCQFQHASYCKQLEIKRQFVCDSLLRIGKISFDVPPVTPSSQAFAYRRHISLKMQLIQGSPQLCFTSIDAKPFAVYHCFLFHEVHDLILSQIQAEIAKIPADTILDTRAKLFKTASNQYVLFFACKNKIPSQVETFLQQLCNLDSVQGLILQTPGSCKRWGDCHLTFTYKDLTFSYSPLSFVQNHPEQSQAILSFLELLSHESQKILDLYCGIGVSTLVLAKKGKTTMGIEINEAAIALAKKNADQNGLSDVPFFCAPAEQCKEAIHSFQPDTILVNPPKTGLAPQVLQECKAPFINKILYVSCHPPTLARDCAILQTMGYELQRIQSFDMFPQTTHVETVAMLIKSCRP